MKTFIFLLIGVALSACATLKSNETKNVEVEKIIFHTGGCFGTCPTYHLEIKANRKISLHKERIFAKNPKSRFEIDSTQIGYYQGVISKTQFNDLESTINRMGIDTLKYDPVDCCDGSMKTIIIYYNNNKRKVFKSMFLPEQFESLVNQLYAVCEKGDLKKTSSIFKFENE